MDNANNVIAHPADGMPFINNFTTGRNVQLAGTSITQTSMGGANFTTLTFDNYGRPTVTANMVITLAYNGSALNVTVAAGTGDVTISAATNSSSGLLNDNGQNKDNGIGQKNGVN